MEPIQERVARVLARWTGAIARAQRSIRGSRLLTASSRAVRVPPNGRLRDGSDTAPTFEMGQPVRRLDRPDLGVVVGALFGQPEKVIVRWADDVTFDLPADLIEVRQPAA
jgi:hypothetical protein